VAIHVADPAEAAAMRGNKRRAKTDRLDARRLREMMEHQQVPESWILPAFVLEVRTKARLYKDLLDEKAAWQRRIHATMFHQGVPKATGGLLRKGGRAQAGRDDAALSANWHCLQAPCRSASIERAVRPTPRDAPIVPLVTGPHQARAPR